jgi:hypothetical protein
LYSEHVGPQKRHACANKRGKEGPRLNVRIMCHIYDARGGEKAYIVRVRVSIVVLLFKGK